MNRRHLIVAALLVAMLQAVLRAEDKPAEKSPPDPKVIAQLISELDSDDYNVRQNATRTLSAMGRDAIAPVSSAVSEGSLETIARAMIILEAIYRSGDDETIDLVETSLENLGQNANQSIAGRAELVLAKCYSIRERRALAEIRKAGGVFMRQVNNRETVVTESVGLSYTGVVLHIGDKWKSGDTGLKHIKRLTRLENMRFVPRVSGISPEAIRGLRLAMPGLNIHERGAAKLGLTGEPSLNPKGCEILHIEPGSAAEEAKLQQGDVIVKFEDKPVADFDSLVEMIKAKLPGDKVALEVRRGGGAEPLMITPVLKGWQQ